MAQAVPSSAAANVGGPEFNIMGFGDISYLSSTADDPGGFTVGQAVMHLSASLDKSFSVFGEFSLTAHDTEYTAEVERLIVKYEFSDLLKVSAGRYHTPIGYWNTAFHHGAWLQTTVSRPEVFRFGSEIVPIHFVGGLLEGTLPNNSLGLSYMAGFGNGRHANIARAGDAGDTNDSSAWMVEVNARPARFRGLHAGIGLYSDVASPTGKPDIDEKIYSAYAVWTRESPEVLFEYLYSTHSVANNSSVNGDVHAWYAQVAYRLGRDLQQWKPYVRYEYNNIDDSDPLLGDQGLNYEGAIVGVRWDFSQYAALKAEYRNEEFNSSGRENGIRLQVSFVLAKL